jgi:phosphoglucosamine mutase
MKQVSGRGILVEGKDGDLGKTANRRYIYEFISGWRGRGWKVPAAGMSTAILGDWTMRQLFGTDGIRGKANTYPITPEVALQVGKSIAHVFGADGHGSKKAVIGKDTRLSGYMIETALTSGLVSMGMDVFELGPLPTPAVAHLTRSLVADVGIMITASHNPCDDNGIKIFSADGFKLPDSVEQDIEEHVLGGDITSEHISNERIGKAYRVEDARGRYIEFAKQSVRQRSLKGLKVVLDCANGAAYSIAPIIFRELGAEVVKIGCEPDGYNINLGCGATHTGAMAKAVIAQGAHLGIALDGDADRVIFCDAAGQIVNGDRILAMCALDFKARNRLSMNTLVLTTMSNLGLHQAMAAADIRVVTTDVGDRHVIDCMRRDGYNIGGEQSGHIIFMDYVTTGDGIITALHVLKLMMGQGKALSELAACMEEYPQRLISLEVREKPPIESVAPLSKAMAEAEAALAGKGRLNVRYSGTENKLRILVEASEAALVEQWSERLAGIVRKELGA